MSPDGTANRRRPLVPEAVSPWALAGLDVNDRRRGPLDRRGFGVIA